MNPNSHLEPHRGTTVLVLGILSIVVCPIIGFFAMSMGSADLRKIDAGMMDPAGRDSTNAGKICGIIGLVILAMQVLALLFFFVVVAGVGVASSSAGSSFEGANIEVIEVSESASASPEAPDPGASVPLPAELR